MRSALEQTPQLTEAQARELLVRCLRVLYYRDARSLNRYEIAVITADGVKVDAPASAPTNWEISAMVR